MLARGCGLLLGHLADRVFGDPRRHHPVAGFGWAAQELERILYRDDRAAGIGYLLVAVGAVTTGAALLQRTARTPGARMLTTAGVTWAVLGGRSLETEAEAVAGLLDSGDLAGARTRLRHLVGRDTGGLTVDEMARAVIESVAENTADAVVVPYLWGAVAGIPGLAAHRAVNTLDAMVGHRSDRYRRFGWAAARLDDLLALPGARLTAALTVALGPDPRSALRVWRRDARRHPSPNAGVSEAAFAGGVGLRLGGVNSYGERREDRALLGDGRVPTPADIAPAVRLGRRVGLAAALVAAACCLARGLATGYARPAARR